MFCSRLSGASAVLLKQALVHNVVCTCFAVLSQASATLLIRHQKPTDWTVDRGSESSTTFPKSLFGCGCFAERGADGHLKSHPGCLDGVATSTKMELALLWWKDQIDSVFVYVIFFETIIISPSWKWFFKQLILSFSTLCGLLITAKSLRFMLKVYTGERNLREWTLYCCYGSNDRRN